MAKVLHPVGGRSMLRWVLEAIRPLGLDKVIVVVGHQADAVTAEAQSAGIPGLVTALQAEQNGTGHAVRQALGQVGDADEVLVLPGDVPLVDTTSLRRLLDTRGKRPAALLTMNLVDPLGFGRVVRDSAGDIARIVEHRDATDAELRLTEVNTSVYAFDGPRLAEELRRLRSHNAQAEEYLTDVVAPLSTAGGIAAGEADAGLYAGVAGSAEEQALAGVNDRVQLAAAGAVLRRRTTAAHQRAGVTVVDPATTYIGADVRIGVDAVIQPGTHLEGATTVGPRAQVGPDSRLVDARVAEAATVAYSVVLDADIGPEATVGPFSYLRPGTRLERGAKAGAYVEIKSSTVGEGSKVPHLSYIGDATIGQGSNIGAATVTVNYDGYHKHRTVIGDRVRIGSDTMLVAPVTVGDDAYTGAGSVITTDVPDGALAVERAEQRVIEGYAERRRRREEG
jgi:bifunctional UDP-N-acetylglucosamine pyrophosphorylase/glucosamine-1-phosphate N-acetyltransferase